MKLAKPQLSFFIFIDAFYEDQRLNLKVNRKAPVDGLGQGGGGWSKWKFLVTEACKKVTKKLLLGLRLSIVGAYREDSMPVKPCKKLLKMNLV